MGSRLFHSVVAAGCSRAAELTGGRHPNGLPQFRWINIRLANRKQSFRGTFHGINVDQYA
jgi:hypothetical protein